MKKLRSRAAPGASGLSTPLKKRCRQSIRRTAISANSRGQARVPGASTRSGKGQAAHVAENARECMSGARLDHTCSGLRSGVGTEPPPASRRALGGGIQEGKIAAGEPGDGEPLRRVSGRRRGRSRGQPCEARCRTRRRTCPHGHGDQCARPGAKRRAAALRRSASTSGASGARRNRHPPTREARAGSSTARSAGEDAIPLRPAPTKMKGPRRREATRPLGMALALTPRSAAPGCRA